MSPDVPRSSVRRVLLAIGLIACTAVPVVAFASPASAAKQSADLSVTLTNKTAKPGHRVSYVVKVTNHGPSSARRVNIDFTTSRTMSNIHFQVASGARCIPSTKETVCLLDTIAKGHSRTATISGVISKKLKKGDAVSNKVTVASDTHLVNTANDAATDNYRIGMKTVAPVVAPAPSASPKSKLAKITSAATDTLNVTSNFLNWSIAVLAAAALWFAIGLTVRAVKRRRAARGAEDRD